MKLLDVQDPNVQDKDEQNLLSATSAEEVDRLNAVFYGKFPYPWRPLRLDRILDHDFSRKMLCQALGDWSHTAIPERPNIFVAGCGTNQALITALNFPAAKVIGLDISRPSLELCARACEDLSVHNLDLREESLNKIEYEKVFDYILCTGVIHHNAQPAETLRRLARALKPEGVLELMVYNRFHRILNSAFQKAVRMLVARDAGGHDSAAELGIAKALVNDFSRKCLMQGFLQRFRQTEKEYDQDFADCLIQPVEHSYTVESLSELAQTCDLELLTPTVCVFDRMNSGFTWNSRFKTAELNRRYYELDDVHRWQITNLLLCESSPMLWFYLRRSDSPRPRQSEQEICAKFLEMRFTRAGTRQRSYFLAENGRYKEHGTSSEYPAVLGKESYGSVLNAVRNSIRMGDIVKQQRLSSSFSDVNDMRLRLTVPAFPYLVANS